jgi:hypothetical protein
MSGIDDYLDQAMTMPGALNVATTSGDDPDADDLFRAPGAG